MADIATQTEAKSLHEIIKISRMVVSSLDLDEVLQKILLYARELVETPAGSIALFDETTSTMTLHAGTGLSEEFMMRDSWHVEAGGLTRKILDQRQLFIVDDTLDVSFFNNPLALAEGIRSLIAVPLCIQDTIVGILYLDDFKPRTFDASACEKLAILASFASLSIANARLHEKTSRLASTDGLTGLFNHRQFKRILAQEVTRTQRYSSEMSLLMIDIDNFKHFNDLYGHPCGDRVLTNVARLLQDVFREADHVFRYGGEEFVVILPLSGPKDAVIAAERARDTVESLSVACHGVDHPLGVTVSVGVASLPHDADSGDALLDVADRLMYQAKNQGKNRVHTPQSIKLS
ncbi:GGDEF domain-containing protein [Geopsychrobacter electrodiphilus]|uniref:GGDEF domain-containing protein n=1 Tax=Geopsychrobacter electrodiphilus TaxID=225196 RepID=UPI000365F145|nr:sensor domain-containing diguanylate cyclase [Geopsychrobacter electrodiphilus]